jgi:hypothetical protein
MSGESVADRAGDAEIGFEPTERDRRAFVAAHVPALLAEIDRDLAELREFALDASRDCAVDSQGGTRVQVRREPLSRRHRITPAALRQPRQTRYSRITQVPERDETLGYQRSSRCRNVTHALNLGALHAQASAQPAASSRSARRHADAALVGGKA